MVNLNQLFTVCKKYYSKKEFDHALRVANLAVFMALNADMDTIKAFSIGLCHDLLEDTDCSIADLIKLIGEVDCARVKLLTKNKDVEYKKYIENIFLSGDEYVILVKRADMKDHLMLTDTLTDKLKEKYFPVLHYFI